MSTITWRKEGEDKIQRAYIEWSTRTLSSFIAATAQVDAKGHKALMDAVAKVSMTPSDESKRGAEPQPGSFEKFNTMMGGTRP